VQGTGHQGASLPGEGLPHDTNLDFRGEDPDQNATMAEHLDHVEKPKKGK
jgi:hypothetical protein